MDDVDKQHKYEEPGAMGLLSDNPLHFDDIFLAGLEMMIGEGYAHNIASVFYQTTCSTKYESILGCVWYMQVEIFPWLRPVIDVVEVFFTRNQIKVH